MTTEEIVHVLKARPAGNNRWFASCPVHKERTASLSVRAGDKATLLHCFGCHAKAEQIMVAMGYKAQDVFYDAGSKMGPKERAAFKKRKRDGEVMKQLELRWSITLFGVFAWPHHRKAWAVMEQLLWRAMKQHELQMDPERGDRYRMAVMVKRKGFDALWDELERSREWPAMMAEVDRTRSIEAV